MHRQLDPFDRAILRIVQRDNKTSQRAIADLVNLSPAAVQRRIAAMEAAGVIAANAAIVDTATLSLAITTIVEVHLRDERAETVDAAKSLFRGAEEVQQCYYVTGGTSFSSSSSHLTCAPMRRSRGHCSPKAISSLVTGHWSRLIGSNLARLLSCLNGHNPLRGSAGAAKQPLEPWEGEHK
ncbi:Winged helix-turn-helix DNA-binding [Azospirillum oryzae]|uniref:Winged helix-turn-helix DNA-binding n=1 Tax=Azospirillum oryzae TaxID=286727 RepID=A0A1X7GK48_9PROT|nr:Winged helix-turn-helix DNA-binding [Azospirillum oryzae]